MLLEIYLNVTDELDLLHACLFVHYTSTGIYNLLQIITCLESNFRFKTGNVQPLSKYVSLCLLAVKLNFHISKEVYCD